MPRRTPAALPRSLFSPFASDRVFRETTLWDFDDPEHAETLRRFGELLFTLGIEAGARGITTRGRS